MVDSTVLPAIGYFETKKSSGGSVPHYITPTTGLLFFAGLYSWWQDPALSTENPARWHLTTTMLTQAATGDLAEIHDRMPVIVTRDSIDEWIDPRIIGDENLVQRTVAASALLSEQLHAEPHVKP